MSYITRRQARSAVQAEPDVDVVADMVERRVIEEIARLRAAAEAEGRAAGEEAGHAAAQTQTARPAQPQPAIKAFEDAWNQLGAPSRQREQDVAALVTDLAFELARHIVGVEAKTNADGLRVLVTRLLEEAAAE